MMIRQTGGGEGGESAKTSILKMPTLVAIAINWGWGAAKVRLIIYTLYFSSSNM
jgi:hypothetical protein